MSPLTCLEFALCGDSGALRVRLDQMQAAALWFPFGHPAVTGVVIGARAEAEVRANVAALSVPLHRICGRNCVTKD